jgi:hypothetical protein
MAPVFYLGDVGAGSVDAGIFTDFRDTPVTLASGTFSLHAPGSQTSDVSIKNGGTTIAFTDPGSEVGRSVPVLSSCGTFGCGAYDIHTAAHAVTSVTMNYGHEGTGTSLDLFSQVLAVTPRNAALTLAKSVTPAVASDPDTTVTYSYVVTNTGNVALASVQAVDTAFSGTGTPSAISCPKTTLDPGQQMTCTSAYRLTQADVDAGKVTNTAVARGTPPSGPSVTSTPSTATVTISCPPVYRWHRQRSRTPPPGRQHSPARPHRATLATLLDFSGDCPSMNISRMSHEQQRHLLLASPAISPF